MKIVITAIVAVVVTAAAMFIWMCNMMMKAMSR